MRTGILPIHALLCCAMLAACGEEATIDVSKITNETARKAAEEVKQEAEAIPELDARPKEVSDSVNAAQQDRLKVIQEGLMKSGFTGLSDSGLDSLRQVWLVGYARSCDPSEFKRIMTAIGTDEVLKQWSTQHVDSARAYHGRLMTANKACKAAGK